MHGHDRLRSYDHISPGNDDSGEATTVKSSCTAHVHRAGNGSTPPISTVELRRVLRLSPATTCIWTSHRPYTPLTGHSSGYSDSLCCADASRCRYSMWHTLKPTLLHLQHRTIYATHMSSINQQSVVASRELMCAQLRMMPAVIETQCSRTFQTTHL